MTDTFRDELRKWLEVKGISRETLAREAGYNVGYLAALLSVTPISEKAERKIRLAAEKLKMDIDEFVAMVLGEKE